eukprot:gene8607-6043_t
MIQINMYCFCFPYTWILLLLILFVIINIIIMVVSIAKYCWFAIRHRIFSHIYIYIYIYIYIKLQEEVSIQNYKNMFIITIIIGFFLLSHLLFTSTTITTATLTKVCVRILSRYHLHFFNLLIVLYYYQLFIIDSIFDAFDVPDLHIFRLSFLCFYERNTTPVHLEYILMPIGGQRCDQQQYSSPDDKLLSTALRLHIMMKNIGSMLGDENKDRSVSFSIPPPNGISMQGHSPIGSGHSPSSLASCSPPALKSSLGDAGEPEGDLQLKYCPECRRFIPVAEWMEEDTDEDEELQQSPMDQIHLLGFSIGRLIGQFVMWVVRSVYFREVTVVGEENIPLKGAAVFFGNHQNQFIDPLMMNSYVGGVRKLRFLMAKKSLSQPIIGTLGRMFESVPVIRPQDVPVTPGEGHLVKIDGKIITGLGTAFTKCLKDGDVLLWKDEVEKRIHRAQVRKIISDTEVEVTVPVPPENITRFPISFSTSPRIDQSEMYAEVYETLKKSQCIGIFPEGGSHDHTSLLPLKAGVAMFSLAAADSKIPIKVVPVGLTYLRGHKFRSRAYVEVGKPISPPPHLVQLYATNKREAISQFLSQLHEALKAVTINVADYPTLKFLHNFRQLYQPSNCFLPPESYLGLIRRLAKVIETEANNKKFQDFRMRVEAYAVERDRLYLQDSQVATLKNLKADPKSKHMHLLIRRCFTLIMLLSILFPFIVVGVPLAWLIERNAVKRTRKAVAESSVKIVGADVKGSFRIMMSFFFVPVGFLLATAGVYMLSNIQAATAVLISLPMAMYISLLVSQEATIEFRTTFPLLLYMFSSYHDKYKQLYQLRKELVVQAKAIVKRCDSQLEEEMERHLKKDILLRDPSLFSIRHSIRRRHESMANGRSQAPTVGSRNGRLPSGIRVMNIIQRVVDVKKTSATTPAVPVMLDWMSMYTDKPRGNKSLFELEALIAKRLELLAWIDQIVNSPTAKSFDEVLRAVGSRLAGEGRSQATPEPHAGVVLGSDATPRRPSTGRSSEGFRSQLLPPVSFEKEEDLTSHLLCRFAFCMSETWRKWFVKMEEILIRARLQLEIDRDPQRTFLASLMEKNGLPCKKLDPEMQKDPRILQYMKYRTKPSAPSPSLDYYYIVPMSLATRLIRTRSVLLMKGMAVLHRDQVQEVFLTVYRGHLNRGLHTSYLARIKQQNLTEEDDKQNVMNMLDAFLQHFIADPSDNLAEGDAGSVRAGDVSALAKTHFPLCMRRIDSHLRREGHLKHHGRFMYGLFLKAIGLSLEDAMQLFASLMTVKGGGSVEAFSKSSYGYNIRHNYGMEGKKTSYTSASCTTILNLPPAVDQKDCHGCPFRFRDEGRLRQLLQQPQKNPKGKEFGEVRPSVADIEDIVEDCKGQHYTRACFRYFMATHPGARRDTLFRTPYEYYVASCEKQDGVDSAESPARKRQDTAMPLKEDAIRSKLEETP